MVFCALPALAIMFVGQGGEFGLPPAGADGRIIAAWAGLLTVNVLRSVSIIVPLRRRTKPFEGLRDAGTLSD